MNIFCYNDITELDPSNFAPVDHTHSEYATTANTHSEYATTASLSNYMSTADFTYSTTDLTAGSSSLETGKYYFKYD